MKKHLKKYISFKGTNLSWIYLVKIHRGFALIEVLIAVTVFVITGTAFLGALATSSKTVLVADVRQTAKTLAEDQMEYVMNQAYAASYTPAPIASEYAGYTVTLSTDNIPSRDANIQEIKVIISYQNQPIIMAGDATLEDYKVN